jgi:RHS repeat-associated protein
MFVKLFIKVQRFVFLLVLLNGFSLNAAHAAMEMFYVHNDHLGSARTITDQSQNVVWQADFSPFGRGEPNADVDGDGVALDYPLRFPGQYFDEETGTSYNWHRTYDPKLGRYVQSDPIGLDGGINTYGYVGGNPVGFVDANGLNKAPRAASGSSGSMTQTTINLNARSLLDSIRRIDTTFRFPVIQSGSGPINYSRQNLRELEQFLRNAESAGYCGPGAANTPGFLNNGTISMTNLFQNVIPRGLPNKFQNPIGEYQAAFRFEWSANGTNFRVWGHTSNPTARAGSHSSANPTISARVNNRYVTGDGTTVRKPGTTENAPRVHIPVTR